MIASRSNIVAICPQPAAPVRSAQPWILSIQLSRGDALDHIHHSRWRLPRWTANKQMHMVGLDRQCLYFPSSRDAYPSDQLFQLVDHISYQNLAAVPRNPNKVIGQTINRMCTTPCLHATGYNTTRSRSPLRGPHIASRPSRWGSTPASGGPAFLPGASAGVSSRRST